jgi:hypothetical protein
MSSVVDFTATVLAGAWDPPTLACVLPRSELAGCGLFGPAAGEDRSDSKVLISLARLRSRCSVRDRLLACGVDLFHRKKGDRGELGGARRVDREAQRRRGLHVRQVQNYK